MIYSFILGTNHSLCKVEIINVLHSNGIKFNILESSQESLTIETESNLDKFNIDLFGSTAKIVKIYSVVPIKDFFSNFGKYVTDRNLVDELLVGSDGKRVLFGISVYGFGGRFKDLNYTWYLAPSVCREIRADLSSYRVKSAFIPLKDRVLSTASVDNNDLLKDGFEIVIGTGAENIYIGKTISIQDYKSYSFRDYGRPARDTKSGMIPPKLAKMMINLTGQDKFASMLDPFCGSGTFLEEMALLGYRNITGTDIEQKAVNDSKTNFNWILKNYKLEDEKFDFSVTKTDVREVSKKIKRNSINAIVSEPYLGSSKLKHYDERMVKKEISMLETLYFEAFKEFNKILVEDGCVVIIMPVFRNDGNFFHLDIVSKLKKIGFIPSSFLPEEYHTKENMEKLNLEMVPERNSIIFYRPDQTVSREIFIFKK